MSAGRGGAKLGTGFLASHLITFSICPSDPTPAALPGSQQKRLLIHQALTKDPVDVEYLREAALSQGGLLTDEIRRKVWPKMLGVNVYNLPSKPGMPPRSKGAGLRSR